LLKNFSLDATFKSVGDVNNVYAFQKKVILDVRVIDGRGGFKKTNESFDIMF
jgi:hypothetical protein